MARLDLRLDEAQLGLEARFQWGPWLWIEAGSPPWSGGLKSFETSLGAQWALSPRAALSTFATWNFELSKSAVGAESYFDAEAFEARAKLQVFVGLPRGRFSLAIDRIVDSTPHTQARLGLLYARDFTTIASPTLYALTTSLAL